MKKQENGITLVALIITIIILLILAVVSIMAVTGTGLFAKTSDAVSKYDNSQEKENFVMSDYITTIDNYSGNTNVDGYYYGSIRISYDGPGVIHISNGQLVAYYVDTNGTDHRYIAWPVSIEEEIYTSESTLEYLPSIVKEGDKVITLAAQGSMRAYLIGDTIYCMAGNTQIGEVTKTELNSAMTAIMQDATEEH